MEAHPDIDVVEMDTLHHSQRMQHV
jgi:hypothetical protein